MTARQAGGARLIRFGSTEFRAPQGPQKLRVSVAVRVVVYVAFAAWSVVGNWKRQPVLAVLSCLVYLELAALMIHASACTGGIVYSDEIARRIGTPLRSSAGGHNARSHGSSSTNTRTRVLAVLRRRGPVVLLLVSLQALDRLDDRQLRAILAHEIVHVVHGDPRRLRAIQMVVNVSLIVAAEVPVIVDRMYSVAPLAIAGILVGAHVARVALAPVNRRLERRADIEGARLASDPAGMASALQVSYDLIDENPHRVLRPAAVASAPPAAVVAPTVASAGRRAAARPRRDGGGSLTRDGCHTGSIFERPLHPCGAPSQRRGECKGPA